jgi:Glucose-6-phosphate dehydrogenase, C-terminal domain
MQHEQAQKFSGRGHCARALREPIRHGAGLDDVVGEGQPVDDAAQRLGVKVLVQLEKLSLLAITTALVSSLSLSPSTSSPQGPGPAQRRHPATTPANAPKRSARQWSDSPLGRSHPSCRARRRSNRTGDPAPHRSAEPNTKPRTEGENPLPPPAKPAQCWRIIDPIIGYWADDPRPITLYEAASWDPTEADRLLDGRAWRNS